ncbi:MAG: LPS export ABC transporter ATP-binding protein [Nitrospira sp.]|nr:LPS export ABC transporter ATP-binding protein [Nitrospira sp.]MCA9474640.1 LPS export ABC transporter ATP-binding protein [Nitrospira sp.]MCA9479219.1 LPS export ABC transporter ATP-binding protein [Nitrospira sp.]MCB9709939.1 LPS export ABC transporter ATP-binding protein [Nitrospiraceae bacterium]
MTEERNKSAYKISANELNKSYKGRQVVRGVSLELRGGEIVGLLGPNGAGKTTIFDMVVGLCQPDQGKIFLNKEDITLLPMYKRARRGVGYLPQEASIFRRLSVEDNVLAVLETLNLTNSQRRQRLDELLEELNLSRLRKNGSFTLSGGERRRLEITRALATNPKFLLLDEPFAGIDPIAVGDIQDILTTLKQKRIGILITDHNVQDTLSITDRAYIISEGSILEAGAPDVIVNSQKARAVYLGERFKM